MFLSCDEKHYVHEFEKKREKLKIKMILAYGFFFNLNSLSNRFDILVWVLCRGMCLF